MYILKYHSRHSKSGNDKNHDNHKFDGKYINKKYVPHHGKFNPKE